MKNGMRAIHPGEILRVKIVQKAAAKKIEREIIPMGSATKNSFKSPNVVYHDSPPAPADQSLALERAQSQGYPGPTRAHHHRQIILAHTRYRALQAVCIFPNVVVSRKPYQHASQSTGR